MAGLQRRMGARIPSTLRTVRPDPDKVGRFNRRWLALPSQQHEQPAVAETPPLVGEVRDAEPCPAGWSDSGSSSDPRPRSSRPAFPTGTGSSWPADARPQRARRRALPFFRASPRPEASLAWSYPPPAPKRLPSETSMSPKLAFQLQIVALEVPCLRARSTAFASTSCSFNSENLLFREPCSFQLSVLLRAGV